MAGTYSSMSINGSSSTGGVGLNGNTSNGTWYGSVASSQGKSVLLFPRATLTLIHFPALSTAMSNEDAVSALSIGTNRSNWTTTSTLSQASVLTAGFNSRAYGSAPHLYAQSARSDAGSSGNGQFAKVGTGDVSLRL
jgi:hypothetical protein